MLAHASIHGRAIIRRAPLAASWMPAYASMTAAIAA